jgi:hypothetical protein
MLDFQASGNVTEATGSFAGRTYSSAQADEYNMRLKKAVKRTFHTTSYAHIALPRASITLVVSELLPMIQPEGYQVPK